MTNLLIGIPAFGSMVHIDVVNTLIGLSTASFQIRIMFLGNESLIPRGRNTLFSHFVNNADYSHLLFLDADIGVSPGGICRLVDSGKDVIAARVRVKIPDVCEYNTGEMVNILENGVHEVTKVGTGVMLISRRAAEDYIRVIKPETYCMGYRGGKAVGGTQYNVFYTGVVDGEYVSEDFMFCRNVRKAGYSVYVDTSIKTVHNGMMGLS